jgi:hypothetical protein
MPDRIDVRHWVRERSAIDDQLHERYGRALETSHHGEFVAISDDGQVILGADELSVATEAIQKFGAGRFALRRIGAEAESRCIAFRKSAAVNG